MMTASLIGLAASPIVAGFISGPELRIVFEADIVLMLALAARGVGVDGKGARTGRRPMLRFLNGASSCPRARRQSGVGAGRGRPLAAGPPRAIAHSSRPAPPPVRDAVRAAATRASP